MQGSHNGIDRRDSRRQILVLAVLVGVMALLGFLCHYPEAHGPATSHVNLAYPSIEHCWIAIPGAPMLGIVMIFVTLTSLTLPLQQVLLFTSPFKPPRAFPPTRGWCISS
jgi:hypothetical protein